jgi:hypothetical protein
LQMTTMICSDLAFLACYKRFLSGVRIIAIGFHATNCDLERIQR